jgi:glutamine synthetase adenylyltransferase
MKKQALSVTLTPENLAWLRARRVATGARSLSETIDRTIESARARDAEVAPVRSVVGLVRLPDADPDLQAAASVVRTLFARHGVRG